MTDLGIAAVAAGSAVAAVGAVYLGVRFWRSLWDQGEWVEHAPPPEGCGAPPVEEHPR